MKSLMLLWQVLALDLGERCCTSTADDFKTVVSRTENEGLSFLTIALPNLGKGFEKSLDQGFVDPSIFHGFKPMKNGRLPQFLGGFFGLVFSSSTGLLLDSPSIEAIQAIRQLTLVFGKMNLSCTPKRERKAMEGFIKCEKEVKASDSMISDIQLSDFKRISRLVFSDALTDVDNKIANFEVIPKHGPGSTADGLKGNFKYYQTTWTERLDKVFPVTDYLIPNSRFYPDLEQLTLLEPGAEIPVKVITVPKTQKTPRIIAIEPTAMQYAQQGILELLVPALESAYLFNRRNVASSLIGFSDQVPNRDLAQIGSLDGSLATLDLSEASDRVSYEHVLALLQDHPHLRDAVDACRSRKALVPGYGVQRLAKFASMGSALCFPFEAMIFVTVIFIGIERALNRQLTRRDLNGFAGRVRVYGDDIIVPVDYVHQVVESLESFGYKVNSNKSFWTGSFRESCGKEFYAGEDVSVVRVKHFLPTQLADVTEVVSTSAFRNLAYFAGLWKTCSWLDSRLERILRYYPVVAPTSAAIGRHSFLGYDVQRTDPDLHSPLVRAYVVSGTPPPCRLDGYAALLKWFLKRGDKPFAADHLERQGRPHAVNIKLRWVQSY